MYEQAKQIVQWNSKIKKQSKKIVVAVFCLLRLLINRAKLSKYDKPKLVIIQKIFSFTVFYSVIKNNKCLIKKYIKITCVYKFLSTEN